MLPEKIGQLFVMGYEEPYAHIKINKALSGMSGKIIECRWHEDKWDFMRQRVDKSYPNHITTAIGKFVILKISNLVYLYTLTKIKTLNNQIIEFILISFDHF